MSKEKKTVPAAPSVTPAVDANQIVANGLVVSPSSVEENGTFGWCIAVVDRGFVYVGECLRHGDSIYCAHGYNIRTWGAKRGLGELAINGPTQETELDRVPLVIIPMRAIIHMIPSNTSGALWEKAAKRLDND